jgi:hypothetical protein
LELELPPHPANVAIKTMAPQIAGRTVGFCVFFIGRNPSGEAAAAIIFRFDTRIQVAGTGPVLSCWIAARFKFSEPVVRERL